MSKKVWEDDSYSPAEDILSEEEAEQVEAQTAQYIAKAAEEPEFYEDDSLVESFEGAVEEETYTEEELEDDPDLIFNARMRLEQGRLYEMLLNHNLFEGASAHPKAVANVERELKTYIKGRLEVLLGLKPDPKIVKQAPQQVAHELPFNDLEITLLKQVLSKMTKGATEKKEEPSSPKPVAVQQETKIKPLAISEPKKMVLPKKEPVKITVKKKPEVVVQNRQPARQVLAKKPVQAEYEPPPLKKHPSKMTASELMARNKYISENQKRAKADVPEHQKLPMPSADQLALHYSTRLATISPVIEKIIQNLPSSREE